MKTPTRYCSSGIVFVTITAMVKEGEEGGEKQDEEGGSQLKM